MRFENIQENNYHEDPSMPFFRYNEDEKAELMTKLVGSGMSEQEAVEEIVRKEVEIINKMAKTESEGEKGSVQI